MLPFTGYNMSDYFQHWLTLGRKLEASGAKVPKIFTTNWFRKGEDGKFVWPGYGENMRVLKWMIDRIEGKVQGEQHVFGISPTYEELNWEGLPFTQAQFEQVIGIDLPAWEKELELHHELFQQLEHRLPPELKATKAEIEKRLAA
jgi:phosphoenolpyruvate carboxykinase (GTP)